MSTKNPDIQAESVIKVNLKIPKASLAEEQSAIKNLPGCELGESKSIQHSQGRGISTSHFVEPVSVISIITLAWLTKRLVDHWLKSKEQGVLIDLQKSPIDISRIGGVPAGWIMIVNKDGTKETIQATYEKSEDLMPVIQKYLVQN